MDFHNNEDYHWEIGFGDLDLDNLPIIKLRMSRISCCCCIVALRPR